jgi:hypothetical protein
MFDRIENKGSGQLSVTVRTYSQICLGHLSLQVQDWVEKIEFQLFIVYSLYFNPYDLVFSPYGRRNTAHMFNRLAGLGL